MPRPKASPEIVAQARELVRVGCSLKDAGDTLGVSAMTIKRWIDAPAEPPSAPPQPPSDPPPAVTLPAHMAPPPPMPVLEDISDPIELVRQLIREQRAAIQADRLSGNTRGAASNAATLERLVKSLKQMESTAKDDGDGIRVSNAELARVRASLAERVTAICNRPLMCARCSRELSVFWGTGLTEAELVAESDSNVIPANPAKS
jgi:hypothetical protein